METTQLVMPGHLNPFGNLFGGTMMSWMDIAAAMFAFQYTKRNCVTVSVSEITFIRSVKLGDMVKLETELEKVGNTSLTVLVTVSKSNLKETNIPVAASHFKFVALDDAGNPDSTWKDSRGFCGAT